MKIYYSLLAFVFSSFVALSQDAPCGTTHLDQPRNEDFIKELINQPLNKNLKVVDEVPIQVHIIGADNGLFALDDDDLLEEINILNSYYANIDIEFVMCNDINYINDNQLVTFIKNESEWICDIEDVPNSINIYYAPHLEKGDGESICGYATDFHIKPRVFVDNKCADGVTLAHEFGHSFSLVHTHRTADGFELVNGSNCETAGDFLCDTPADPTLSGATVNSNCVYTGNALDQQQNPFNPDVGNVMSYSRAECVTHFSEEQLQQMRAYYDLQGSILNCMFTSTQDATTQSSIKVYPNPVSSSLFVDNISDNATIEISNSSGQHLSSQNSKENTVSIEIEEFRSLSDGIYYLRIYSLDGFFAKKIIKTSE